MAEIAIAIAGCACWAVGLAVGWWARGRETEHELRDACLWLGVRARAIETTDAHGQLDVAKNTERLRLLDDAGRLSHAPHLLRAYRRSKGWWRRG